jgi:hypothetical protein
MAKTLLDGVNDVLKRASVIQGDTTTLTSLTSSNIQPYIDLAIQVWNEAVEELYSQIDVPMPNELASSTITLVADDRDYALATDLVQLHWPLHDQTNGNFIHEFSGGYLGIIHQQTIPADYTGIPSFGAIRPTDGEVYLDRLPTSEEAGNVYTYQYDKDVSLSAATDTFPFDNAVYRAMVPVARQLWGAARENELDADLYTLNLGRAGRLISKEHQRESWGPYRVRRTRFRHPDFQFPFGRD